jgi:hypothetical protein
MRVLLVALAVVAGAGEAPAPDPQTEERLNRAEAVLAREEGQSRAFDPGFRAARRGLLSRLPEEQLAEVERRGQGLLPAALLGGPPPGNLVLNPTAPCRIIDTRIGSGPLTAGETNGFYVAGNTGFKAQGGVDGGCGIPFGRAAAVVINFVAVAPAGPGNLRAWPSGDPVPNASVINYAAVGLNIANGLVVRLCNGDRITCGRDLDVRADVSATHLVADVLGYFLPEERSLVRTDEASSGGTPVPVACSNTGGISVTVTTTGAGSVSLRGNASIEMIHFNSQDDEVKAFIGTSTSDCTSTTPATSRIPAALPSFLAAPGMWVELNPVRVVNVGPGTHTYYLNFQNTGVGAGNDRFRLGHLEAVFHPSN